MSAADPAGIGHLPSNGLYGWGWSIRKISFLVTSCPLASISMICRETVAGEAIAMSVLATQRPRLYNESCCRAGGRRRAIVSLNA